MNTGFAGPQLTDVSAREQVSCILADDEYADLLDVLPEATVRITGSRIARADRKPAQGVATCSVPAGRHGVVDQRNHRNPKRSAAQPD